jgi:hypothetical protein
MAFGELPRNAIPPGGRITEIGNLVVHLSAMRPTPRTVLEHFFGRKSATRSKFSRHMATVPTGH